MINPTFLNFGCFFGGGRGGEAVQTFDYLAFLLTLIIISLQKPLQGAMNWHEVEQCLSLP